jgi:serine/threonine protein kinase/tetratricopeptide (TPR) repeat protein
MTDGKPGDNERSEGNESLPTAGYGVESEGPGAQIGPYKLISILGEGGYGIVYLADQHEPVRRRVALKVIKPGMDSRQVIARFEAERQALALLDHPNVAHVHEAGTTAGGRPYFAMEYVKGVSIVEHCDRHKLSVEERLELFLQVCEAVQHAHQKGIIHRDIKPSNILVSFENERAIPKVIDFGIAKAISQPLTERTLYTERGQLVGTLEYMSPEQAEMTSQDIDTRSDIYSMGVVLYELLTGVLPFESDTLRQGDADHLRQIIREQDPKTPSTRVSRLTREDSSRIAQQRRAEAGVLRRKLRGDLDWITLKAMDKDRMRRYASASELAADIRRHLANEPVAAGPPSRLYRMRKYVRRHRALVTGLTAVLVVFLAGVAGVVVFAVKADQQAHKADQQARTAQAVVDFLNKDLLGSVSLQQAKSVQVTVHSILDAASERLEGKFADEPLVEASIRQTLGNTYLHLGDYDRAGPHTKRAYELRRTRLGDADPLTLASASDLGILYLMQTRYAEAKPLLTECLESRRRILGPEHADTAGSTVWLGVLYMAMGDANSLQEADRLLTTGFEMCTRILGKKDPATLDAMSALALLRGGLQYRFEEAIPLCLEGMGIAREVLGEEHLTTVQFTALAAFLEACIGQLEEARRHAQAALEIRQRILGREHPDTLYPMCTLGWVYSMQLQPELAEPLLVESVRLGRSIQGKGNPWIVFYTMKLARVRILQGRYQEAESLLTEALADGRSFHIEGHPMMNLAVADMIDLYVIQERADKLQAWCSAELERLSQAPRRDARAMASIHALLAWRQATYPSAAIRDGAKAIENATKACELTDWNDGAYLDVLAAAYAEAGDFDNAVKHVRQATQTPSRPGVFYVRPETIRYHLKLYESKRIPRVSCLAGSGRSKTYQEKYVEAERELATALPALRRLFGDTHPETRGCILALIEMYEAWGKPEQAEKWRAQLPPESVSPKQ